MIDTTFCRFCACAEWDFVESYDRHRQYFIDGCRKDLEPVYNAEEECIECEGYEEVEQ